MAVPSTDSRKRFDKDDYCLLERLTNFTGNVNKKLVNYNSRTYAYFRYKGEVAILAYFNAEKSEKEIPNSVTYIGECAFRRCENLEQLYISNAIESIGNCAFEKCKNILDIKIGSKKAIAANENIFHSDVYNNACLYVPTGRKFAYEKTFPWSNFYILEMDFTAVNEVKMEDEKLKLTYDLNGRVVENPTTGVYIINGKKVLLK